MSQSSGQQSNPVTLISQPAVQLVHQAISQSGMTGGAAQSVTLQQLQQHLQNQASSLAAQQPVLVCTQDRSPTKQQIDLSHDVTPGSDITLCNKIDKPLVVYRFSGNLMTSIIDGKILMFTCQKCDFYLIMSCNK